jgi:L-amino acid N-acyltransferase YncA
MPVRDADPERDGAACAAVYAPYVTSSPVTFETEPPGAAEMTERIEAVRAAYPWLVLERDGRVAGYAYASLHRARAGYRWAADVAVYVDAAHHGTGAGRELYGVLIERLRGQRIRQLCAGIALPNAASVGLHESFGFELVGVYRNIGWKAGEWLDVGWWQLDLGEQPGDPPPEPLAPGVHP